MTKCPTLGRVPGIVQDDLKIKSTQSGIIYLPQTRYRKRYTGSKFSQVDINGKLYLNGKDLRKVLAESSDKGKKISRCLLSKREKFGSVSSKDTNDISTPKTDLSTENNELLTSNPQRVKTVRSYTINKREVRQRILGYLNTMKGKKELYFWTVTFPEKTADDLCYQLFNTWLTQLRKYKMIKDYLWIAERQPLKTKTIHFHIAVPHYMDVHRANSMMRISLRTMAIRGDIAFTPMQCYKYNGVHLAKDKKTNRVINFALKKKARSLAHYLTKYLNKTAEEEKEQVFTHLAWHNSRGYSAIFTGVTFTIPEFQKWGFNYYLDRKNMKKMEFAVFIPWINGPPPIVEDHLYQLNTYIQSQLN